MSLRRILLICGTIATIVMVGVGLLDGTATASRARHSSAVSDDPAGPHRQTPINTVPIHPLTDWTANRAFYETDGLGQYDGTANTSPVGSKSGDYTSGYWVSVPPSYHRDNRTPETLIVWLHACSGLALWDVDALSTLYRTNRSYILMSLSGPESQGMGSGPECWNSDSQTDTDKVLTDIRQIESEFNIDRRRIFIGGYSSGGDVAWQTIFEHASTFAGILAMNTNPVAQNSFGQRWGLRAMSVAIRSAAWKFHVVQVAHSGDTEYHLNRCGYRGTPRCVGPPGGTASPDFGMAPAIQALRQAGFPVLYTIYPGHHYDAPSPAGCDDHSPATCTGGSLVGIYQGLLDRLSSRWQSPAT